MYVFSVFELTSKLEEALTSLETKGISKNAILAVPLNRRNEGKNLFDTAHYSDNASTLALPFVFATMGSFLGGVIGFQLHWGPVLWCLIGGVAAGLFGLCISVIRAVIKKRHQAGTSKGGVVVVVKCEQNQNDDVQQILWNNTAMGVYAIDY